MSSTSSPAVRGVVFSSASDNWPTPQPLFDRLNERFTFVLDPCSSRENHKTNAWFGLDHPTPSRRDGLAADWAKEARKLDPSGAVWVNPPYGRGIGEWMAKAAATAAAGVTVVCLVPARTDTAWFHDHVLEHAARVEYLRGRVKFGDAKHGAPFASLVIIYTARGVQAVAA